MVWCAGLLVLPVIYAQRAGLRGEPLHELHRFTRAVFIRVTSPAAFTAVIAGSLLIFMRDVFTVWMALKLVAVGVLVALHIRQGYVIQHLFAPDGRYASWRRYLGIGSTALVIAAVLVLVLAKPSVDVGALPDWALRPGGLQSLLETRMPIP